MNATFYSGFSKRRNSTKQPSGGTTKSVALKEGTSLMHPEFILASVTWTWNYASAWGNYYYVVDIISESNGTFRVKCEIDVLATFKTQIGAYSTTIARSDMVYDDEVLDTVYPALDTPEFKSATALGPGFLVGNRSNGTVMISTVGQGGQGFYVMSKASFDSFCNSLFPGMPQASTLDIWLNKSITEALVGGLQSIVQNIVALKWIPVSFTAVQAQLGLTHAAQIPLGNWNIAPYNTYEVTGQTYVTGQQIMTFPGRTDGGSRGKWLYMAPFANYTLYVPGFGAIALDGAHLLASGRRVFCEEKIDCLTGNTTLSVYYNPSSGADNVVGRYTACFGFDMQAGGGGANVGGIAGSIAGTVAAAVTKSKEGLVSSIASAVHSMVPVASQVGGGFSGPSPDLTENWRADVCYFDPIEENRAEIGRPLGGVRNIGQFSGFVQCADAHCPIPGHEEEMIKVNEFLNTGFFYE